jgi:hypothetical protein
MELNQVCALINGGPLSKWEQTNECSYSQMEQYIVI